MSSANDIKLFSSPGGIPENIELGVPYQNPPDPAVVIGLSDTTVDSANGLIILAPFGAGVTSNDKTVPIGGLSLTISDGSLRVEIEAILTGQVATGNDGQIKIQNAQAGLIGQRATTGQGSLNTGNTVDLLGSAAITIAGDVEVNGSVRTYLLGQKLNTRAGKVFNWFVIDTFTDTDGTTLSTHNGEFNAYWGAASLPDVPVINSNRLAASDAFSAGRGFVWQNYVLPPWPNRQDYFSEADIRYDSTSATNSYTEGVAVRIGFGDVNGYIFGWNQTNARWQLDVASTGVDPPTVVNLASSTTNVLSSVGDTRTIRLEVYENPSQTDETIRCFVDGVLVISYVDSSSSARLIYTSYENAGLFLAHQTHSISFDAVRIGFIDYSISGAKVTTTAGTVTGDIAGQAHGDPLGRVATATCGSVVPELAVALTGRSATTAAGTITVSQIDVSAALTGYSLTSAQGLLVSVVAVGATVADSNIRFSLQSETRNSPPNGNQIVFNNKWIFSGKEATGVHEYAGRTSVYTYIVGAEGRRRVSKYTFSAGGDDSLTCTVPGGDIWPTYWGADTGPYGRKFIAYGEQVDYSFDLGGKYSVDKEGNIHWLHSRGWGRSVGINDYWANHYGYLGSMFTVPDIFYVYQNTTHTALARALARRSTPWMGKEAAAGLYAHTSDNAYVFYQTTWTGVFPFIGQRLTTAAGTLVGVAELQPNLVGQQATAVVGAISTAITGSSGTAIVGSVLTTHAGSVTPFISSDTWVPTYRRWNGYDWGNEIQLKEVTGGSLTGATNVVATRSGYGDIVYLSYMSGTNIGFIVMDAVTEKVYSHTITTPTDTTASFTMFDASTTPSSRPISEVIKLSSGTSVTQYLLNKHVVHISWTSGTVTTPTVTLKDGPGQWSAYAKRWEWPYVGNSYMTYGGYYVTNWEGFDYRGDQVIHILYGAQLQGSGTEKYIIKAVYNDVTGTGSTWVNQSDAYAGVMADNYIATSPPGGVSQRYTSMSVSGEAQPTSIQVAPGNNLGQGQNNDPWGGGATFKISAFIGQSAYQSVSAEGRVGKVNVIALSGTFIGLTGLSCTASNGSLGLSTGAVLTGLRGTTLAGTFSYVNAVIDSGQRATLFNGTITALSNGWAVNLTGQLATTAYGTIIRSVDNSSALIGVTATTANGSITPSINNTGILVGLNINSVQGLLTASVNNSVVLTGQGLTTTSGVLVSAVNNSGQLQGAALTLNQGTLGRLSEVLITISGLRITTNSGSNVTDVSAVFAGQRATSAYGSLGLALEALPAGRRATTNPGTLSISTDIWQNPTGVQAVGKVGNVGSDVPAIDPRYHLWARTEVAKLFAQVTPEELYNDDAPTQ